MLPGYGLFEDPVEKSAQITGELESLPCVKKVSAIPSPDKVGPYEYVIAIVGWCGMPALSVHKDMADTCSRGMVYLTHVRKCMDYKKGFNLILR